MPRMDWNLILSSLTKQKKQRDMQSMIDQARKQGADIDMEYDAESGQFIPHIKYKRQSKSEQLEDMLKVQKMIMDVRKGEREEKSAQEGEQFNWLADLGFGGGAQRLSREGTSGQVKPEIKRALEMRNKFRGTGQTLLPTETGWTRSKLPKTYKGFAGTKLAKDKLIGDLKSKNLTKWIGKTEIPVSNPTREDAINHLLKGGAKDWETDPELSAEVMKYSPATTPSKYKAGDKKKINGITYIRNAQGQWLSQ